MSETADSTFVETLLALLTKSELPCQAAGGLTRRLAVAQRVFDTWTENGSLDAALAERFLDGSISVLEEYLHQRAAETAFEGIRVERRNADQLTYEEFVLSFLLPNRPVIIQGVGDDWQVKRDLVLPDGGVNLNFLVQNFGHAKIWATETTRQASGHGSGKRHELFLKEFVEYWERHQQGLDDRVLYLKDWHFVNEFPEYQAYTCPLWFADDWLNNYHDLRRATYRDASTSQKSQADIWTSDYRFVYLGPKGTWTPIHADVLRSFSWSTNVAGRKRWRLLPPEFTPYLFDRFGREIAPAFDVEDGEGRFPNLALVSSRTLDFEQGVNEALFVPSGWHHSVENLEDTLSVNHNWLNGFNIHWGLQHLQKERAGAAAAIEDCRSLTTPAEFEALVQRNMAANCGMNFESLADFMATIALRQLRRLAADSASLTQQVLDAFALHRCTLVMQALLLEMDPQGEFEGGGAEADGSPLDSAALESELQRLQSGEDPTQLAVFLRKLLTECKRAVRRAGYSLGTESCI